MQPLGERRRLEDAASGGPVEREEVTVVAGVERAPLVHRGYDHLIAHQAVRARLGPGGDRGRVDAGHGGEDGVAVHQLHALGAQPDEGGRVLGGDGVGPEPVHHEDEDPPPVDRH